MENIDNELVACFEKFIKKNTDENSSLIDTYSFLQAITSINIPYVGPDEAIGVVSFQNIKDENSDTVWTQLKFNKFHNDTVMTDSDFKNGIQFNFMDLEKMSIKNSIKLLETVYIKIASLAICMFINKKENVSEFMNTKNENIELLQKIISKIAFKENTIVGGRYISSLW